MSGPIVRTGATPKLWDNYDAVFGDKKATAGKGSAKKAGKKASKKGAPAKASAKKKPAARKKAVKKSKK